MILADYFRSTPDDAWDIALQCGVCNGVIRLPEEASFDLTNQSHWRSVYDRFQSRGIRPLVIEPMPNCVHDHIKAGDGLRDESIDKVIKMLPIMRSLNIDTICFNWMAHIGWLRTASNVPERGGAKVTEFNMADFTPTDAAITADQLWDNYTYFLKAVLPEAEKNDIKLALHPDDPPVPRLGNVERIMISGDNIRKAVTGIVESPNLGITMCQANFYIMGEDLTSFITEFAEKIFLVHFRNVVGTKEHFRETFHDNGQLDMAQLMDLYVQLGLDVPVRVDHVPTLVGEASSHAGYDALGRLYAIGYLKGLMESANLKYGRANHD